MGRHADTRTAPAATTAVSAAGARAGAPGLPQARLDDPGLVGDCANWLDAVAPGLAGCAQDPIWHPEGDVRTHTLMVLEALLSDPGWRALGGPERQELLLAALLHDVGKPATTRLEDGRLRSPAHARVGAIIAREILWRAGLTPDRRELVCALVRHHMIPNFLIADPDPRRRALWISLGCRADHLAILSRADTRGRGGHAAARADALERIDLFQELCAELGCIDRPYPFPSDHARFWYFRRSDRDPAWDAHDDSRLEVVLLSGLPGAGKDHWAATHLPGMPVVSLDKVRTELGIGAREGQGRVVAAVREQARIHLRAAEPFVWSATNLSRQLREQVIGLLADYRARVRIVSLETTPQQLVRRNRLRQGAARVPQEAVARMVGRWEAPDLSECHALERVSS